MKTNNNIIPQLHLGPMSKNVIVAVNDFAVKNKWPICLIASRRQIDGKYFGGGYVNNLTTESFSKQNILNINKNYITLARDHGGPFQGAAENTLDEKNAIQRSLKSFEIDIINGLKIIHIDPQMCIKDFDNQSLEKFIDLTKYLLQSCYNILAENNIDDVDFEIGSDEGICMDFSSDNWEFFLTEIFKFTRNLNYRDPLALACPLGTKVREIENTGTLFLNNEEKSWLNFNYKMVELAQSFNINLKLHNADYVNKETIQMYTQIGINQFNIAPELGVIETLSLIDLLKKNKLDAELNNFYKLSFNTRKWERWLKDESNCSDIDKSIISGHYVFSSNEFNNLRKQIDKKLGQINVDNIIKTAISTKLNMYYEAICGK